jgi:hypothetical protein
LCFPVSCVSCRIGIVSLLADRKLLSVIPLYLLLWKNNQTLWCPSCLFDLARYIVNPPDLYSGGPRFGFLSCYPHWDFSKLLYDWHLVSMSWCRADPWTCDQILLPVGRLLSESCGLVSVGRPLWREVGSAVCSAITRWSESRRTRNRTLLSHLRLPQPGGPGSCIYIPQEQGGPVIPPGTGFLLLRLLRLAGLRWRYSNPPTYCGLRFFVVSSNFWRQMRSF